MLYHSYSSETGEYTGSHEADRDPLEEGEVYLLPGDATWIAPPAPVEGKWRRFDVDTNSWVYEDIEVEVEPEPEPVPEMPVMLNQFAGAKLTVDQENWEVLGVEKSIGISGAFLVDVDLVYVFFDLTAVQPDTYYMVFPTEGVTKHTDFVEVSRPNLAELNFIAMRVQ